MQMELGVAAFRWVFLGVFTLLGMLFDAIMLFLVCLPPLVPILAMYPVIANNLVAFGAMFQLVVNMGQITPPVGVTLYSAAVGAQADIAGTIREVPFFFLAIAATAILVFFVPGCSHILVAGYRGNRYNDSGGILGGRGCSIEKVFAKLNQKIEEGGTLMNFFEAELKKYERRIKKIRENPHPFMLKSNELLYEIYSNLDKTMIKHWEEGKPFAYSGGGVPYFILKVMGIEPLILTTLGDRAIQQTPEAYEALRGAGYPDQACDRTVVPIGLIIRGDLPPGMAVVCQGFCELEQFAALYPALMFDAPAFCLDRPYWYGEEGLEYMTKQIYEMIDFIERNVPGAKEFREDKLVELQEIGKQEASLWHEIHELKRAVPCPVAGQDAFRLAPYGATNDPKLIEYLTMYRDELKERVEAGKGAVNGEEKLRFAWSTSGLFYARPFDFLANLGVSVPYYEYDFASQQYSFRHRNYGDETEFGRKLTPIEEEARLAMSSTWGGPADERIDDFMTACRELKIDAVVQFMQTCCATNNLSARILEDRLEKEMGIPSLLIEGRCLDQSGYNEAEFNAKLEDFVYLCLARKGLA